MESIFLKLAQYPIVETEHLLLRPVTLEDAEAMKKCLTMPRTEKIRATLFQPIKAWKKPRITLLSSTWLIPWVVGE